MTEKFKKTSKGRIAPNGYKLCDPLPPGAILKDTNNVEWVIGKPIGMGGFGEIYLCHDKNDSSKQEYVMKVDNYQGPLFVEVNCVLRTCLPKMIKQYMEEKELSFLGIPKFLASGSSCYNSKDNRPTYRFIVMEKLGEEFQKILETRHLKIPVVCRIAKRIIDVLEYLHLKGYIHGDIKAQNILRQLNTSKRRKNKKESDDEDNVDEDDKYYLIDYGLAEKFLFCGKHREFEYDRRKANNGTCEFRSCDAHIGYMSRRSDLESLGYNLIVWFYGRHPWCEILNDPDSVLAKKRWALNNIDDFLKEAFSDEPLVSSSNNSNSKSQKMNAKSKPSASPSITSKKKPFINTIPPKGLKKFFETVKELQHDEAPDYSFLKKILDNIAESNQKISLNGNKVSRKELFKAKKQKIANTVHSNGFLSDEDQTEIDEDNDSVCEQTRKKTSSKSKKNTSKKKSNKNASNKVFNAEVYELDSETKTQKQNSNNIPKYTRLSRPIMARTPPDGGSPLFGPFEDDFNDHSFSNSFQKNKLIKSTNDSEKIKRQDNLRSCRVYINNKRYPQVFLNASDSENDNNDQLLFSNNDYSIPQLKNYESKISNGKSTPKENGLKKNSRNKVPPLPSNISTLNTKSFFSKPLKAKRGKNFKCEILEEYPRAAPTKNSQRFVSSSPMLNSPVVETKQMQLIRERIQKKKIEASSSSSNSTKK